MSENALGDGPVEAQFVEQLNAVMTVVNEVFNGDAPPAERQVGIIMMLFPYNDHAGRCNYISNGADRRDVMVLLREQLARFEGMPAASGRA